MKLLKTERARDNALPRGEATSKTMRMKEMPFFASGQV